MDRQTISELVVRARGLADQPGRAVLGIAGAPGSGKSTLGALLVERLAPYGIEAVQVPMDGFHLPQDVLVRSGLRHSMGAIDTFGAHHYLALLRRLRNEPNQRILAPGFDRTIEEPRPDAIVVRPRTRLVITEGNYLLDDEPPWPEIRAELDQVWFVDLDESVRLPRLIDRHVTFGKTLEDAEIWVEWVDQPNARRVAARRHTADFVVNAS